MKRLLNNLIFMLSFFFTAHILSDTTYTFSNTCPYPVLVKFDEIGIGNGGWQEWTQIGARSSKTYTAKMWNMLNYIKVKGRNNSGAENEIYFGAAHANDPNVCIYPSSTGNQTTIKNGRC